MWQLPLLGHGCCREVKIRVNEWTINQFIQLQVLTSHKIASMEIRQPISTMYFLPSCFLSNNVFGDPVTFWCSSIIMWPEFAVGSHLTSRRPHYEPCYRRSFCRVLNLYHLQSMITLYFFSCAYYKRVACRHGYQQGLVSCRSFY